MKNPIITNVKQHSASRLFNIEKVDLTFSNESVRQYERIKAVKDNSRAVMIIPMIDDDHILLIREYAVGVERYTLSFPKGGVEENETLYQAADRELSEECGYRSHKYEYFKRLYLAPSYLALSIDVIIARNLFTSASLGDEPEPIIVEKWHLKDIDTLLSHEDVIEGRTVACLLYIWRIWMQNEHL